MSDWLPFDLDYDVLRTQLTELVAAWGPRLLGAITVLVVGCFVAAWMRGGVKRVLGRTQVDETLRPFVAALTFYTALTFFVLAAVRMVGVDTTSFIAVLGAVGLAVALAFQGTLSNFAAGVMILMFRPFRIGDFVEIGGDAGAVDEVSIFTTRLNTADNVRIIMPNSKVWGERIKNYTANPTRRLDLVVGVSYDDDPLAVKALIESILASDERVLAEPEAVVEVLALADSSVNFAVRPWVAREEYWALHFALLRRFKVELEAAGFSIPFPQRSLHLEPSQVAALLASSPKDAKPEP